MPFVGDHHDDSIFIASVPMNEHEYQIAWSIYIAAALGLLLVWFRLTRRAWPALREVLRIAACVLLFSPTVIEPSQGLLAPSLAIVALDLLKVGDYSENALHSLQFYALISLVLYLPWMLLRHFWQGLRTGGTGQRSRRQAMRSRQPARKAQSRSKERRKPPPGRFRRIEPEL